MHIVTKILAVFGAILSVLLAALTISYSANADKITEAFRDEQNAKIAYQSAAQNQIADWNAEKARLQGQIDSAANEKASIEALMKTLQSDLANKSADLQKARLDDQSVKNTVDNLTATAKANAALIEALTKEIGELRNERIASTRRETELVDRLNDLESQRQVLEQNTRALQEQLAEAKLTLERVKSGNTTASDQPYTYTGPLIQGRVLSVSASPAGGELAEISEGSNSGVKANMKFSIVREGKFIANVVMTTVDLGRSVGRIDKLGRTVEIRSGDIVLSRLD